MGTVFVFAPVVYWTMGAHMNVTTVLMNGAMSENSSTSRLFTLAVLLGPVMKSRRPFIIHEELVSPG